MSLERYRWFWARLEDRLEMWTWSEKIMTWSEKMLSLPEEKEGRVRQDGEASRFEN